MESFDDRLKVIEDKVNENNKMLHKLRAGQKSARFMRLIYIVVIGALSYYSYIAIRPYLAQLQEVYGTLNTMKDKTSSINIDSLNDILKDFTK